MCATVFVPQHICCVLSSLGLALVLLSRRCVLWMHAKVDDVLDSRRCVMQPCWTSSPGWLYHVSCRLVMPWRQMRQQSSEARLLYPFKHTTSQ